MEMHIKSDGKKIDFHVLVTWRSVKALIRGLLAISGAGAALLGAPEVARIGSLLGWW
jgi:hypothetical protein